MNDSEYEEGVVSLLRGRKGCYEELSSISEFKEELEETDLAQEELKWPWGWLLWRENERQLNQQIITLLKNIPLHQGYKLVQFWGVEKVEGQNHYLSTSNYPFSVGALSKGICWFRKLCRDHHYIVDVDDQEQQQLIGGVGRAYRKKQPESSPDLRLYSTSEFPMRDEAARCGFRAYLALPIFQSHTFPNDQCCGVLELLSVNPIVTGRSLSRLDEALQVAGLRSTHSPILSSTSSSSASPKQMQLDNEIREILELAMLTVPRLYLTQVWVPCQQCVCVNIINTNSCYMHIESFKRSSLTWSKIDDDDDDDDNNYYYYVACKLLNLQIDVSKSFDSILCDVSISKNPLAHYAQRARISMSHSFAISLQSLHNTNHLYLIMFYLLPPKFREDDDACGLLFKMMNMNLKRFHFVPGGRLVSESQNSNAIECESTDRLKVMKSYKQVLPLWDFMTYLDRDDSCCLRPSPEDSHRGWIFGSLLRPIMINDKIENFMKNIHLDCIDEHWIIQFWAPKMVEDRCYLEASDQPYVVGCLSKGLALFREKCTTSSYFVDDQAKEEEHGPPGRVFRNGHPEISPDLFNYTTKEYPIRNYAMDCCNPHQVYLALPIFDDELNHKCVGVLEFLGFHYSELKEIARELKAAKLRSTHNDFYPRFLANDQNSRVIISARKEALTEVRNSLVLILNIPQFCMANVWVPNGVCVTSINSNTRCMELALTEGSGTFMPTIEVRWIHVQFGKGMVGMVLASENKSCFCQNLGEFSIADQPLSHFEKRDRRDVCFAICLQSSHTGSLVYVVEFFLYQAPKTYEYLRSFFNFLLPIMKHELKSFKIASGKEIGEKLVVDVIEFSDANKLDSSEPEEADVFPIKLRSVQYRKKEHQHSEERQIEECSAVAEHQHSEERQIEECSAVAEHQHSEERQIEECSAVVEHQHSEEQQTEECSVVGEDHHSEEQQTEECRVAMEHQDSGEQQTKECSLVLKHHHSEEQTQECTVAAASDSKREKRGKRKTQECTVAASNSKIVAKGKSKPRRHLTREDLEPLFDVEKLKDVRKMLNVSKATLYRARKEYDLLNWPGKLKKNPLPGNSQRDAQASTSTSNIHPLDTNTASTHHVNNAEKEAEAEKVTIKATYREDTIRLELCLPLEFAELITQVARKLNLDKGAFKLKYLDEDGADILLTDDADLQLCRKTQITLMHKTFIQLFVR